MTRGRGLATAMAVAVLAAGCASSMAAQVRGMAGPVAWELERVRRSPAHDGRGIRWDYTLVLRETRGQGIRFERVETSWLADGTGGRREAPLGLRLEPLGTTYLEYWQSIWPTRSLNMFLRYHGRDDAGRKVMLDIRFTLAPGLFPLDPAGTLHVEATRAFSEGRYRDGLPKAEEALRLRERALGPGDPDVAASAELVGRFLADTGSYPRARQLYEQALRIREEALGPRHPHVALTLNWLARLLETTGEYPAAQALLERALEIQERALGADHPSVAESLTGLARVHAARGDYAGAQPLLERVLRIREASFGPHHREVAIALNNLGALRRFNRDYAGSRSYYRRALETGETALGPDHPWMAWIFNGLGLTEQLRGDPVEAERLLRRAVVIREKWLGPEHPLVGTTLSNLAGVLGRRRAGEARGLYERARRTQLAMSQVNLELDDEAYRSLLRPGVGWLRDYLQLLAEIVREPALDPSPSPAWLDAFVVAEQARAGSVQAELARAGARAAAGDPRAAALAREVQDLRHRRQAARRQLSDEYGRVAGRDPALLASLQRDAEAAERSLAEATARLLEAFPDYAELTSPLPTDVAATQKVLREGEALLAFFTLEDRLLVWAVPAAGAPVYRDIAVDREALAQRVSRLRASVDPALNPNLAAGQVTAFDVAGAHELYRLLIAPAAPALTGVRHLFIVPDQILLPLPFAALVTEAGGEAYQTLARAYTERQVLSPGELARYAQLSWLARSYAISVLPAATSLRALRRVARAPGGDVEPFVGFGDPALEGQGRERGGAMLTSRGRGVPVDAIRRMNRLPGTRDELMAVAVALGADPRRAVYVGERATKPAVLDLNASGRLGQARIVSFATHGLLSGELAGLAEPALVLTPPRQPNDEDDGLLGLEDVLRLKLPRAEWVILSACNTAAGDGGGEGLSGLARAFFFAGARAVLVSHWSVDDRATQRLMAEVFRQFAGGQSPPRAEALRHGMLRLMGDGSRATAYFAHPFAWAPFFLVGEGG